MSRIKKVIVAVIIAAVIMMALKRLGSIYPTYMGHIISLRHWPAVLVITIVAMVLFSKLLRRSIYIERIIKDFAGVCTIVFVVALVRDAFWGIAKVCDGLAGNGDGGVVFVVGGAFVATLLFLGYCAIGAAAAGHRMTF